MKSLYLQKRTDFSLQISDYYLVTIPITTSPFKKDEEKNYNLIRPKILIVEKISIFLQAKILARVKVSRAYTIPFTGLKFGKHEFDYEIDQLFFDQYEYSLVKKGKFHVHLELEKKETMLVLLFHIKGTVNLTCDRCLAEFPSKMELQERQLVQFSDEENGTTDDEILILAKNEFEIDIAPLIYEFINVHVPYHKVCDELSNQNCNAEMLKFLQSGAQEEDANNAQSDPRWAVLNKLKK